MTDEKTADEKIGDYRQQVQALKEEAEEIKSLNQLLLPDTFKRRKLNRHLLYYASKQRHVAGG